MGRGAHMMMLALCIGSVVWVGGSHDVGLVYRECGVGGWLT